ncbi:MAG TPA: YgiT-type zinc finger protein [Lacipirellula sp.]
MTETTEICPVCGGHLVSKRVEKLLRGGDNMAVAFATAEVCQRCGERLYTPDAVQFFERIRARLAQKDTSGFIPLGQSFEVVDQPNSSTVS